MKAPGLSIRPRAYYGKLTAASSGCNNPTVALLVIVRVIDPTTVNLHSFVVASPSQGGIFT